MVPFHGAHLIYWKFISAQPVTSLLANRNQTKWLDLMKKAGFADESDSAVNRTMFVPSEEAIEKAKLNELEPEKLKEVMSLHISDQSFCSCQMKNNLMIPTLKPNQDLRVTTYETVRSFSQTLFLRLISKSDWSNFFFRFQSGALFVGLDPKIMVQCASIIDKDEKACDTMVHEIDKVLSPASETIFEKINNDASLSKLKQLLAVSISEFF